MGNKRRLSAADFLKIVGMTVTDFSQQVSISRETIYAQLRTGKCSLVSPAKNKYHKSHPLRGCYDAMLARCYNPNTKAYHNYGKRGIKVCPRWFYSFDKFVDDVGVRPSSLHSIDRVDNNGHYGPDNFRWATRSEQNYNRRPKSEWSKP